MAAMNNSFALNLYARGQMQRLPGLDQSWTILQVKQEYVNQYGGNAQGIDLMKNGRRMQDHRRLQDYGIIDGVSAAQPVVVVFRYIGGGGDDQKVDPQVFVQASARKKAFYNQFTSVRNLSVNNLDDAVKVDDPHFVVTLNNLDEFMNGNNYDETNKLRELKRCISNQQFNDPILDSMRQKLANVYSVPKARVVISDIFYGTTNVAYYIKDYKALGVEKFVKNKDNFIKQFGAQFKSFQDIIITPPPPSTDGSYEIVKSYHVSCASSKPCDQWNCSLEDHNLGGVVLYMKDGKTDWYCNGRHCKIGYIIVKTVESCKKANSNYGAIHGNVYKTVFNEEPSNVIGSGFARRNGTWKWNSGTFNLSHDDYHSSDAKSKGYECQNKSMSKIEEEWIKKAVRNWFDNGTQNTKVDQSIVIFKD